MTDALPLFGSAGRPDRRPPPRAAVSARMEGRRAMSHQPLTGLRVLDLTSVVVGPACTWRLGQYGAEIIKVEAPEGDLMRGLGGLSPTGQHSGTYLHLNRGKRNVCLDLKKPGAKQ